HDHHAHAAHSGQSLAAELPTRTIGGLPVNAAAPAAGSSYFMNCTVQGASDMPFHVPPSPVHDILPALTAVIALVLISHTRTAPAPGHPHNIAPPLLPRAP